MATQKELDKTYTIISRFGENAKRVCDSLKSKVNPNQNETVLVSVDEVSEFVSSNLRPDCVLIISQCSTFKAISNEK